MAKEKPLIDKCDQCKSLRAIINDSLNAAKGFLEKGEIDKASNSVETARKWIPLFLEEDHGPDCIFSKLKQKGESERIQ